MVHDPLNNEEIAECAIHLLPRIYSIIEELKSRKIFHRDVRIPNHTTAEHSRDVFPSFDDPTVNAKLNEFHQHLLSLESAKCSVCHEKFPICSCRYYEYLYTMSYKDQQTSKLYSAGNNMDHENSLLEVHVKYCLLFNCRG